MLLVASTCSAPVVFAKSFLCPLPGPQIASSRDAFAKPVSSCKADHGGHKGDTDGRSKFIGHLSRMVAGWHLAGLLSAVEIYVMECLVGRLTGGPDRRGGLVPRLSGSEAGRCLAAPPKTHEEAHAANAEPSVMTVEAFTTASEASTRA